MSPRLALAVLLLLPASARAEDADDVRASIETVEPLMAAPATDWAAFDRGYAALERSWSRLPEDQRAPYELRHQKIAAFAALRAHSAGSVEQARAELAARIGVTTRELEKVQDAAGFEQTLRGLYDGGRISRDTLDGALSAMGSMPGGAARDLRLLAPALAAHPRFRGAAFGATEPPSPDAAAPAAGVTRSGGFDAYRPLKYQPGFQHLDFVNPDAPKGGSLRFATTGKFDTYNPFDWTKAGGQNAAPNLRRLVFETLMTDTGENGTSHYGLIAESLSYPKDLSWAQFKIRPQAHFSNGAPVTAEDIRFSYETERATDKYFDTMSMKPVTGVQVVDERTIRFFIKADNPRQAKAAIEALGWIYALNKEYYTAHPLASLDNMAVAPLGSGPYVVEKGEAGKYVVYRRDPNYWGKDLPLRKGQFNFDEIRYDRYGDAATARMAFERGDSNIWFEGDETQWRVMEEKAKKPGATFKTRQFDYAMPPSYQGIAFNTRRPIFQDARARRAMSLAMNFTWINEYIFSGGMKRSTSFFQGTPFAHTDAVSDEERRLLAAYKDLPPEVFAADPNPSAPAPGDAYNRENLKKAMGLLKDAGWSVDPDTLKLARGGKSFVVEVAYTQPAQEKWLLAYAGGLRPLGIELKLRRYDSTAWQHVVDQGDYDMLPVGIGSNDTPDAAWLRNLFSSASADDTQKNRNYAQVRNPAVDALIDRIDGASTQEEWMAATRALDRVLLGEAYFVPMGAVARDRMAYRDVAFGPPPPYYGMDPVRRFWSEGK